jgi:hypothetical protein
LQDLIQIKLNALVRRTEDSTALKALIRSTGATLSRKGRSRNWLLTADNPLIQQIIDLIYQAEQDSWFWLVKALSENRQKPSCHDLLTLVKSDPSITVTQLIALTDCTLIEARAALDAAFDL